MRQCLDTINRRCGCLLPCKNSDNVCECLVSTTFRNKLFQYHIKIDLLKKSYMFYICLTREQADRLSSTNTFLLFDKLKTKYKAYKLHIVNESNIAY